MSEREPSLIALLLITAWHGMKTIGEIIAIAAFIGSILLVAKLAEPQRAVAHCTVGNTSTDCVRQ